MTILTPLRFQPLFRRYLWGGRRLGSLLNKPIGSASDYAESWELVDHGADQSTVLAGPLAGRTLGQLLAERPREILGRKFDQLPHCASSDGSRPQFPLLMKFLDAHQNLSVQVHPNDTQAARQSPPDSGKTEAWVVLHADPGAKIYAGLKRGFDRAAFEREVARNTTDLCLHSLEPGVGDCLFIPAGTVHAIGAGLVVAEIQQSSDTTFRLFDWNRLGQDGQPRPLHVAQALAVIDFSTGPIRPQVPQRLRHGMPTVERLVDCSKFVLDRWSCQSDITIGGDDQFHLLVVVEGEASLAGDPVDRPLVFGQTALLPAAAGSVPIAINRPAVLLDITGGQVAPS